MIQALEKYNLSVKEQMKNNPIPQEQILRDLENMNIPKESNNTRFQTHDGYNDEFEKRILN